MKTYKSLLTTVMLLAMTGNILAQDVKWDKEKQSYHKHAYPIYQYFWTPCMYHDNKYNGYRLGYSYAIISHFCRFNILR